MPSNMLNELSGFDTIVVKNLEQQARQQLGKQNAAIILVIFLVAVACGVIAYQGSGSVFMSMLLAIAAFAVFLSVQGYIVNAFGSGIEHRDDVLVQKQQPTQKPHFLAALVFRFFPSRAEPRLRWKPPRFRFFAAFIFCLLSSQALLLSGSSLLAPENANRLALNSRLLRQEAVDRERDIFAGQLQSEIALETEQLMRLSQGPDIAQSVLKPAKGLRRKALLIGNQHYQTSPLNNPRKDATDLAAALTQMGFDVTLVLDATEQQMFDALNSYMAKLEPGDLSFYYFSGHGFQQNGSNYLVPVDSSGDPAQAVSLNGVVEAISARRLIGSIVVIDACRAYTIYGSHGGLALTETGANTYLAFAAKPGQLALDGQPGANGKFTAAILKHIRDTSDVDAVFREARVDVLAATNNTQEPWTAHNLRQGLILNGNIGGSQRTSIRNDSYLKQLADEKGPNSCEGRAAQMKESVAMHFLPQCLNARIQRLTDDLAEFSKPSLRETIVADQRTSTHAMLYLYRAMWQSNVFMIPLSMLATILLFLPFLWRESGRSLSEYELQKLASSKTIGEINERYKLTCEIIERHMPWMSDCLHDCLPAPLDTESFVRDPRENEANIDRSQKGFQRVLDFIKNPEAKAVPEGAGV